jgi:hypothetical protein
MRGDILLYSSDGSLRSRAVSWWTRGPFVHSEVDLGDGTAVGVTIEEGIARHALNPRRMIAYPLHRYAPPERIEDGIAWLLQQVGGGYSWSAIFDHVLPVAWTTALVGRQSLYSCSSLIAHYLDITGGLIIPHRPRKPFVVSPNDIARAAGLLR